MTTDHDLRSSASSAVFVDGAELLKAMAHPLRLSMLAALIEAPCCVHELVDATGATQPLVSQHLRILRSANLVQRQQRGREAIYAIADDHINHIVVDTLDHVQTEGHTHDRHMH